MTYVLYSAGVSTYIREKGTTQTATETAALAPFLKSIDADNSGRAWLPWTGTKT